MLIKFIVYITFGFNTTQVKWIFEFEFRTTLKRRQSESMVNRTRINSAQSIFFFGEYHPSSSNSSVAKIRHVSGRGFMIQGVIWNFIKCLPDNQNQLFYMKVKYSRETNYHFVDWSLVTSIKKEDTSFIENADRVF